jgi:hypothetical protein
MTSVRTQLADALAPLLPAEWRVIPYRADLDGVEGTVVKFRHERQVPAPNAQGSHLHTIKAHIISPLTDADAAEDDLDELVSEFLHALRLVRGVRWTEATKGAIPEGFTWEVSLEVTDSHTPQNR